MPLHTLEADYVGEFVLDAKALTEEGGDLIIEGLAADFNLDDQNEAFEPGAFEHGIKAFIANGGPMLHHHKLDQPLGQWTEARLEADGLHVKGILPKPAEGSPLEDIYNKVKRGMIRGLSIGGKFKRRRGRGGKARIWDSGIREISLTALPVSRNTLFEVATKAFADDDELDAKALQAIESSIGELTEVFDGLERAFDVANADNVSDHA